MDITNQSPSVNLKRSSLSDSDNKPNNEGGLSHTSVNQSCWRFPWPQVFQVSSPKTSPKTSKKEGNWLQVFKQDKPSTPQGSSGKIGSSGDSSTLRREESTGEKESNGAREDEISSNAEKAKGGEAEQPLQNGSSSGKAENERKGPRAGLSLHSTVTCLSKEEMDKLAKERMMTLVRGMLAAQNLQGDNVPVEVDKVQAPNLLNYIKIFKMSFTTAQKLQKDNFFYLFFPFLSTSPSNLTFSKVA